MSPVSESCPDCGGRLAWLEIVGSASSPDGSIHGCRGCDREFNDRELYELGSVR